MAELPLKNFAVVHFLSDNAVDVVPLRWLTFDQTQCPFPGNRPKGFKSIQEDPLSIADPIWPVWKVKVKAKYGKSYESVFIYFIY